MRRHFLYCLVLLGLIGAAPAPAAAPRPRYDPAGRLEFPADYQNWHFLSASLDMRYAPGIGGVAHHMFDNVFAQPWAVAAFHRSGHWPDGTMLVLENRGGSDHGSIVREGLFQNGTVMGLEVHVRDARHLPGGWGFFSFDGQAPARRIARSAACYACHAAHGAVDTSFVQFYPTLIGDAERLGTVAHGGEIGETAR